VIKLKLGVTVTPRKEGEDANVTQWVGASIFVTILALGFGLLFSYLLRI
jgi:hypothetical protein